MPTNHNERYLKIKKPMKRKTNQKRKNQENKSLIYPQFNRSRIHLK